MEQANLSLLCWHLVDLCGGIAWNEGGLLAEMHWHTRENEEA